MVAIAVFGVSFVSICWLGIFLSHAIVKSRFHRQPGLNDILGDYLQYFGWLLDIELGPHLLLAGLISSFTATMICLIAILDHPFRGHIGVSPEAFELVYNQIMLKY